jgi:hypothetical protein
MSLKDLGAMKYTDVIKKSLIRYFSKLTRPDADQELSEIVLEDIINECTIIGNAMKAIESPTEKNHYLTTLDNREYNNIISTALHNYINEIKESIESISKKYGIQITTLNKELDLANDALRVLTDLLKT